MGRPTLERCPACGEARGVRRGRCRLCGWQRGEHVLQFEDVSSGPGVGTEVEIGRGGGGIGRRELLLGGGAAAVVVGAVFLLGRGGGGAATLPTTTTSSSTTTPRPTTTTTRPRPSTTVSRAVTFGNRAELVVPGAAPGTVVYALTTGADVVRIDVGSGAYVRRSLPREASQGGGLLPRSGGVVLTNGARLWFLPDDPAKAPRELGFVSDIGWVVPDRDPAKFWIGRWGEQQTVQRMGIDGRIEEPLTLPLLTYPSQSIDTSGLFLLQAQNGGAYAFDPTTGAALQVTTGRAVARSGSMLVEEVCDATLQCRRQVRDGLTGAVVTLQEVVSSSGWWNSAALSPDNRFVAVAEFDARPGGSILRVYTSADGVERFVDDTGSIGSPFNLMVYGWSPDSRFLFFARAAMIAWWDAATGASGTLDLRTPGIDAYLIQVTAAPPGV